MNELKKTATVSHNTGFSENGHPPVVIGKVANASSVNEVRLKWLLSGIEKLFLWLNHFLQKGIPQELNPFTQLGAVANTSFIIALISGILLLFWYSPSVYKAYVSLQNMGLLGSLFRSLHRYSSDGFLLFAFLHGVQTLGARKFGGARALAWISGIVFLGLLWFDGWTGYWLVWDERAQQIALGTAKLIDILPLFADPLGRSFLTNENINTLFFFIIFFIHMFIPLAMGLALWIHIIRINKPHLFTGRRLTLYLVATLILVSIIHPATSAKPADMHSIPLSFTMDIFYLLPLYLIDRFQAGVLWMIFMGSFLLLTFIPVWLTRRKPTPSVVVESRCTGCKQCYLDCPYNAITLLPREGRYEVYSHIDPKRCVACGVCIGSCDSTGILSPELNPLLVRKWLNKQAEMNEASSSKPYFAFVCAESAGNDLVINEDGENPELPDFKIVAVPCLAWVHPLLIERVLRRGAKGVLLVGCKTDPLCRNGNEILRQRLQGVRKPFFRKEKVSQANVKLLLLDKISKATLLKEANQFRHSGNGSPKVPKERGNRMLRVSIAAILLLGLMGIIQGLSDVPYSLPATEQGYLVVSFKLPGKLVELSDPTQPQEDVLPHMKMQGVDTRRRKRAPVHLKIMVDGKERLRKTYRAGGLFNDSNSIGIEKFPLAPGPHEVQIFLSDTPTPDNWAYVTSQKIQIRPHYQSVVLFDKTTGFRWYLPPAQDSQ
ncbi:MAG: hydrogenase iron-sulfur subunit [Calditrichaeota bacterium]|nr:MAG: hydrogenase iron-sulfur subunit [Calditrichota bacterium]